MTLNATYRKLPSEILATRSACIASRSSGSRTFQLALSSYSPSFPAHTCDQCY